MGGDPSLVSGPGLAKPTMVLMPISSAVSLCISQPASGPWEMAVNASRLLKACIFELNMVEVAI